MSVVTYRLRENVAWITMNRPDAMNASNAAMKEALREAFMNAERDTDARAIVLTGAGRAFSAGGDQKEAAALSPDAYRARVRMQQDLCVAIWNATKPVIAAVNGYALGGGLEMALMCDIRLAARSATMGTPATRIGSISTGALHRRLPQVVGEGRALHMLLTGVAIDAEEAYRAGLVTRICEDAALDEEAQSLASNVAGCAPAAIQVLKTLFRQAERSNVAALLEAEEQAAVTISTFK